MNTYKKVQEEKHYKEVSANTTVEKLKGILNSIGIEVEEDWMPVSSVGTYSLRLSVKGTQMGTNGKGVSREYAMASAYAEFFERYQNNILTSCNIFWDNKVKFRFYIDELKMNSLQIAGLDNSFMNMYFEQRDLKDKNVFEKAAAYYAVQKIEYHLYNEDDKYVTLPFYSVKKKMVEYLPFNTYFSYYGSNGMCAGNTPEEALVQGLSEIMERYVQKKILLSHEGLPDIPETYLEQYEYLYKIYMKLKENTEYTFLLKDCSLGGKYPVAGLIAIHKNTGYFGVKFGSHPYFPLAIERTFTEANQGIDITSYAHHSILDFENKFVDSDINVYNSVKFGIAQYPFQILSKSVLPFVPVKDVSEMTNKDILDYYVKELIKDGYDILIRDVSYLGFPSFHIIIPTMSEILNATDTRFRAFNSKVYMIPLINHPNNINEENCEFIINVLDYYADSQIDNNMKVHYGISAKFETPGEEIGYGWLYLTAMCRVLQGNYKDAALRIAPIAAESTKKDIPKTTFYKGVKYYLEAMSTLVDHKAVMDYINCFFDHKTCKQIDDIFKVPSQVLIKQYPDHNYLDKNNCLKNSCCDYHHFIEVVDKLKNIQETNLIQQINLKRIFEEQKKI